MRIDFYAPIRLLVVTIVCVFATEALIMMLLSALPQMGTLETIFLDATLIVVCSLPVLYFSLLRPLREAMLTLAQSEKSLLKSESKFRSYADSSPYALIVVDENGLILDVNDASTRISGYSKKELLKINLVQLFPPKEKNRGLEHFSNMVKFGKFSGVVLVVIKNGDRRYWKVKAVKLDENRFLGFISDVTSRMETEKALKASEEKYRLMFETASKLITSVDSEGILVDCNNKIEEVLGYKREEIIGQNMGKIIHSDYHAEAHKSLAELTNTGITRNKEYKMIRKDGRLIDVNINSSSITDKQGNFIRSICLIDDITENKHAEKLQKALYKISESVNQTSNFQELLRIIHETLGSLIDTTNFYIALYDAEKKLYSFPYCVDQYDETDFTPKQLKKSLTDYVRRTERPIIVNEQTHNILMSKGEVDLVGLPSPIWLGVPLKTPNGIIGVVVVQSYSNPEAYSEADLNIMSFASEHIALAIERKQTEEKVEQLAAFAMNNPAPVLRTDLHGQITLINPEGKNLLGRDVTGESIESVLPGAVGKLSAPAFGNTPLQFEQKLGDDIYLFNIQRDESTQSIYIFGSNITEIKRLQDLELRAERLELAGTIAG
ncbi:MAG: PAS domain S-box protein [Candidatus Zixiibacteriota bacterium]